MRGPTRKAVTVEVQGLEPLHFLAAYSFIRQKGREYGLSDLAESQFRLELTLFGFVNDDADAEGLRDALLELGVDASIGEVGL